MTKRFNLIAATLGFVLTAGIVSDVAAQPVSPQAQAKTAAVTPTHMGRKIAHKSHRLTFAQLRHIRKLQLARHQHGPRIARTITNTKTVKDAGVPTKHLVRHAMNHRVTEKAKTVIR